MSSQARLTTGAILAAAALWAAPLDAHSPASLEAMPPVSPVGLSEASPTPITQGTVTGRVIEEGTRDDIFDRPREDYTRALLEASPRVTWMEPAASAAKAGGTMI